MNKSILLITLIFLMTLFSCGHHKKPDVRHALFRVGFRTDSSSTGPLFNSGFIFRWNDTLPPVFLTAFHVVARNEDGKFCHWSGLKNHVKNGWLWCQYDSTIQLPLGSAITLQDARASHLDLAAFKIETQEDINYLKPASLNARVDDTVHLFTKFIFGGNPEFSHPARIVYAGDSAVVYEFTSSEKIELNGTSGSPVLNKNGEVVALSFGSLTFPNEKIKENVAKELPLVNELVFQEGKTYAIGVPAGLIKASLVKATMCLKRPIQH